MTESKLLLDNFKLVKKRICIIDDVYSSIVTVIFNQDKHDEYDEILQLNFIEHISPLKKGDKLYVNDIHYSINGKKCSKPIVLSIKDES